RGISAAVAVLAHLPYQATESIVDLLDSYPTVVSIEEGYTAGGLASLAAQAIAGAGLNCRHVTCGVTGSFPGFSGSTAFMRRHFGLTAEEIAATAGRHAVRWSRAA